MGERSALKQEPGYDGLCNYAQKITSCFGLNGKTWGGEDGGSMFWSAVDKTADLCEILVFSECRDTTVPLCVARFSRFVSVWVVVATLQLRG